ncbi:amidase [Ruixingdingia sedimenti]|uniref:Amidase n=1 Tax=Ruixingdingia sedimenti TaxID=3073604 RepID=A0ABU1F3L9_9RHOB|nr:amidase [Xinfangfangia sp. LG-4]MDR5651466.1 amidase [Xinfangfangia sp. LG-4]
MSSLADLSAVDLVAAYRDRSLSPVEVTAAVLTRIAASEPHLKAMWALDPEGAMDAARAAEARWAKGEPAGPIDGVPVTIKDNIATKGVAVPLGCAALPMTPSAHDDPPAAHVRASGGVILGKTTMPDLGMLSSGLSSFHDLARNPWDLATNPGGSSAGAGAAAAAGYGPLHIGTDIGGSIRLPAGWCGLVGLKPTYGRIPMVPPFAGRVAGPMTRTVADTALFMSVLSRPDARDNTNVPGDHLPWLDLDMDVKGLRIGLWLDAGFGQQVAPEVTAAVTAAARAYEAAGATIVPVAPFLTRAMIDGLDEFWRARSWATISALPAEKQALILPYITQWAETARGLTGMQVYHGFNQMNVMRDAAMAALDGLDFMLSPVAPTATYPADWASPVNDPQRPFEHIAFTVSMNMSGQPAVSVNCGYTGAGLPIGLQITGHRLDDLGVLRMAHAFEQMRPAQRPWPLWDAA